jgi:GTP-binding protein EngB required for normal cell division
MDLKQYEQKKFALAEIIRSAQSIDTKDETLLSESRGLLTRLAEDRFHLMVVGRFSRGKSTLMNAILGEDHLPTGIVPLTSVITTVRYGSRKHVVLHFIGSGLDHEVPLSQLANYVTQQGNPGNVKRIACAEIQLPVEILRRGLFFVDSPGLGSPIVENTLTTENFLPEADAFILVTSYESPLSEEEDRILHRICNTNKKLFVILNKQDMVSAAEREQVLAFVEERLKRYSFSEKPRIFSVSARQGLEAKLHRMPERLETSGLPVFEAELFRFLTEDRALSFLASMYDRTLDFLVERSRSSEQREQEEAWKQLIARMGEQREMMSGITEVQEPTLQLQEQTQIYPLSVDRKTGCYICGKVLDGVFRFLSKFQYDLTIRPEVQEDHARRKGFCPLHTWQYEGISSPQGVCEGYPKLTYRMAAELNDVARHASQEGSALENMHGLLPIAKECRACQTRREAEKRAAEEVADMARRAMNGGAEVHACCLPHLVLVGQMLGRGEAVQRLLASHAHLLERTAEDLQRYAIKHDALRRHLASEEERRAAQLALLLLAGHRNVSAPWVIEFIL